VADKVCCNMCGKELDVFDMDNDYSMAKKIGYGSVHDGDDIKLNLCSNCLDNLISMCKITPLIKNED